MTSWSTQQVADALGVGTTWLYRLEGLKTGSGNRLRWSPEKRCRAALVSRLCDRRDKEGWRPGPIGTVEFYGWVRDGLAPIVAYQFLAHRWPLLTFAWPAGAVRFHASVGDALVERDEAVMTLVDLEVVLGPVVPISAVQPDGGQATPPPRSAVRTRGEGVN